MNKNLNVVELFSGVGGFRVDLEKAIRIFLIRFGPINGSLPKRHKVLLTAIIHTSHRVLIVMMILGKYRIKHL